MRKHSVSMVLIGIFVLGMTISGCQTNYQPGADNTPEPTEIRQPTPTQEQPEINDPKRDNQSDAFEELKALLPEKEGFKWIYNGFAEYGHELALEEIKAEAEKVIYAAKGEVADMSDGESMKDFSLSVRFIVDPLSIVQDKIGDMMMDTYDHIVLIQAPLQEGTFWTQDVKNGEGKETTLECNIEKIEGEEGDKVYTVVYQDKNGPYYEKRVIKEGVGVIGFTKLYITDEESFEVSYLLYEEASGYDKQGRIGK